MEISEIRNNVPLPARKKFGQTIYPFANMKRGDSFIVSSEQEREIDIVRRAAFSYGRTHGWKFSTRKLSPTEIGVWRIK